MVPHVVARKTHQRLLKFSFVTPKRLLQQYLPTTDSCTAAIVASRSSGLFGNSSPKPRPRAADPLVGLAPSGARSAMMPIAIFLALAARRWRIARGPTIITTCQSWEVGMV